MTTVILYKGFLITVAATGNGVVVGSFTRNGSVLARAISKESLPGAHRSGAKCAIEIAKAVVFVRCLRLSGLQQPV